MVDSEKYLGFHLTSTGMEAMIDKNIQIKRSKIITVANKIRNLTHDPKIQRIGRLKAASLMIQAQIMPMLLYSTEAWLNMTDKQVKVMEDILKEAICTILSLPKQTNYEALLYEVGNFHIQQWMELMKLKFYNKMMHIKKKGRLYRVIRSELIEGYEGGVCSEIKRLSTKYNLLNIMLHYVRPSSITREVKEHSTERICEMVLTKKSVHNILITRKPVHEHHTFVGMEARAISCYNTGNLGFKAWNPQMFRLKDKQDRNCLFRVCEGVDSDTHVRYEYQHYDTKYVENCVNTSVKDNALFLTKLNIERRKKFGVPLIVTSGWS